jgi:thiamine-phosphate pyrophosphorylase
VNVPRLYLITDRHATRGRPLAQVVAAALQGAEPFRRADGRLPVAVAVRDKDLAGGALFALAREVAAITNAAGADLFVNGRVDVALACGATGVHLPADGLSPSDVRAISPQLAIAVSTHTPADIAAAAQAGASFAVFGPVFDTPSKQGVLAPRGLRGLADAARGALPVIALGGVTPDNAAGCLEAGAAGVACIRAVLAASDPLQVARAFLSHFRHEKTSGPDGESRRFVS